MHLDEKESIQVNKKNIRIPENERMTQKNKSSMTRDSKNSKKHNW